MPKLNTDKALDLYNRTGLRNRIQLALFRVASQVLASDGTHPNHTKRSGYALKALQGQDDEVRRVTLIGLACGDIPEPAYSLIDAHRPEDLEAGAIIPQADLDALFEGLIAAQFDTLAGVIANQPA